MFTWIEQIIAEIPRPRNRTTTTITLPGLQEITRFSVSSHSSYQPFNTVDLSISASDLLQEALETRLDDSPAPPKSQWDWTWRVVRRLPVMNKWFFMYGLLDCTIQLAKAFGPANAPSALRQTLQRLAYESSEEHFRYKAVSNIIGYTALPPWLTAVAD